jgi:hypothetical protein
MTIYSEQKIRRLDQMFMNISFCLLLICPVIVLSLVDSRAAKLSIVVGFLLIGAILMALGTGSNNSALAVLAACVTPDVTPRLINALLQHSNGTTDMLHSLYSFLAQELVHLEFLLQ